MEEIKVPILMDKDKVIIPEFWLGKDVEYKTLTPKKALEYAKKTYPSSYKKIVSEVEKVFENSKISLSALYYNFSMNLPTLAESRHALEVSKEYRDILERNDNNEWTSTFLKNGKKVIERPEIVIYKNGVWVTEGGIEHKVELPPDGWVTKYDKITGFPIQTLPNKEDAEKIFGKDTSYFDAVRKGLMVVYHYYSFHGRGIHATHEPDHTTLGIGGRACRRLNKKRSTLST